MFGQKRNRRLGNDQVLEVKPQVQLRRARRARWTAALFSVVTGISLTGLLLWHGSQWALDRWVFSNPAFAIARIEVRTDGILPPAQVIQWSGVGIGDNLVALDLATVQRDLELQPLIESASIERLLPDGLRIHIIEREPIARAAGLAFDAVSGSIREAQFYLDANGHVLQPIETVPGIAESEEMFASLPRIAGIPLTELLPGKQLQSPQAFAALKLVLAFQRAPVAQTVGFHTIDITLPGILRVATDNGGDVVLLSANFEPQLERWRLIDEYARRENKSIATLDLAVGNNVPARWNEYADLSPPALRPVRSSPYRKKHV